MGLQSCSGRVNAGSAYTPHKNPAVLKIMEAMRTAYAIKNGTRSQHISVYIKHKNVAVRKIWTRCVQRTHKNGTQSQHVSNKHDVNDHGTYATMWKKSTHRLRRTFYFAVVAVLLNAACFFLFLFVGTHFHIFVRKCLVHVRTVYAHLLKS